MKLTYLQFEVLVKIESNQELKYSQRSLGIDFNVSIGTINKIINELLDNELLKTRKSSYYEVTLKGYELLETYRVKKAVFIAAGFGSRLVPITLNTPKPLIKVHGKRIIETLLDAVVNVGIKDITIVRGYLGEQFDVLLKKYPMIKFLENPLFNEANNIYSAFIAKNELENAYVFDADLVLYNPSIIRKYEYSSNYLGVKVDRTDDWCFKTSNLDITDLCVGGNDVYHMFGISYWSKEDGKRLSLDIERSYKAPGGKEMYWDQVSLRDYKDNYTVKVRPIKLEDIIEIDTFNELKNIDPIYNM